MSAETLGYTRATRARFSAPGKGAPLRMRQRSGQHHADFYASLSNIETVTSLTSRTTKGTAFPFLAGDHKPK